MSENTMNRRQFVRALSTAGAAAVVAAGSSIALADEGAAAAVALGDSNVNFSQEVDVLIVGAGISGMLAALDPATAGLKTLIVEQNGFFGGDAIYSAGSQMCDCAKLTEEFRPQKYSTIEQVRERFAPYYEDENELEKFLLWRQGGADFIDMLHYDWGYEFQETVEGPYQQAFFPKDGICAMVDEFMLVDEKITEAGAEYLYDTTFKTLIAGEDGTILGARFIDNKTGAVVDIAAKATILATGGYASNQEWMTKYAPETADLGCIVSGRTGEGIKAGLAAGGVLAGMKSPGNLNPRYEAGHMLGMFNPFLGLLPNGKRFYSETAVHDAATGCLNNGYHEWWSIWDGVAQNGRRARRRHRLPQQRLPRVVEHLGRRCPERPQPGGHQARRRQREGGQHG